MEYWTFLWLFSFYTSDVYTATHWMVTETGLIQPREDSPFQMNKPYDLLAFLNQDTRWDNIRKLYNDMMRRQKDLTQIWDIVEKNSDVNNVLSNEPHCQKSGPLNMVDWYTSPLEEGLSKHIPQEEYLLQHPMYGQDVDVPDCKKISSLTYSMSTFEHLESIRQREKLIIDAELSLPELISPIMNVEQFGHWLTGVLRKNSSSWLHYNLASLYWRVRGNAVKALECSRRAVHYAPRRYKDISLLSMGTTLHRGKKPEDAIIVLGAAVDHEPQCAHGHFVLGNAYAVLGQYNNSVRHYDKSIRLNPGVEQSIKNKHAVLCLKQMIKKMRVHYKTLKKLHKEVTDYAAREALWLKSQAAFLRTMKHDEEFDYTDVRKILLKMSEITGLDMKELKKESDKFSVIKQFLDSSEKYKESWIDERGIKAIEAAYEMQSLMEDISKNAVSASDFIMQPELIKISDAKYKKEIGPMPVFNDANGGIKTVAKPGTMDKIDEETYEYEVRMPLYPPTMKIHRNVEDFDKVSDWPSEQLCKEAGPAYPESTEVIYPVFLPFENKGLRLKGLLTHKINLGLNIEHELPWHPPVCPHAREAAAALQKKARNPILTEVMPSEHLRNKLMEYVSDGHPEHAAHMQDAEIGQRIHTAMQMDVAPKWMIFTLTSLYWRVRGNNVNALHCLISASKNVKSKFKDVVLTSLASVYLEMGLFDEALQAAEESFRLSLYEPATNFVLAELNMLKKHRNTQMFHMKQVIRVEPGFMGGAARSLLLGWGCLLRTIDSMHAMHSMHALGDFPIGKGELCTQVEPGMAMMCDKDGTNCHMTNVQCVASSEKESTSTLVRLMEIKKDSPLPPEPMDWSMLDAFMTNMPLERGDRVGHEENFLTMVRILEELKGCGPIGCDKIRSEDLKLKQEDCSYQFLQLGYWLHIVSFQLFFTEADLRLPNELLSAPASNKRIPECRVYAEAGAELVLSRVTKLGVVGWEQIPSLVHQFSELFIGVDFVNIGAKMARFIETRPRSWLGALVAGWWCGAAGRGACTARCLAAAYTLAPPHHKPHAIRAFAALLHMQTKHQEAKEWAYLSFYLSPKSQIDAFLVALTYTYQVKYEQAVWMYRYALSFDEKYLPAKACLHATMCVMLFGESAKQK